jgi:hypothetical protein
MNPLMKQHLTAARSPNYSLTWLSRSLLVASAFLATAVYAGSFFMLGPAQRLTNLATDIAISSGIAWIGFGCVLLMVTRKRPSVLAWVDACLLTMLVGNGVLLLSVLVNVIFGLFATHIKAMALAPAHAIILFIANGFMMVSFIYRTRNLGMRPWIAALLWVVVLNGFFALLLFWFKQKGDW